MTGERAAVDVAWLTWGDHSLYEHVTIRWENNGWTVQGVMPADRVEYAIRLDAEGDTRQFLLFRDLEEPDLWLAHDGRGAWGEVNGAQRADLADCQHVGLERSVLARSLPIRRLAGHASPVERLEVLAGGVDPDTLAITAATATYTRLGQRAWDLGGVAVEVDADGLILDVTGIARRRRAQPGRTAPQPPV